MMRGPILVKAVAASSFVLLFSLTEVSAQLHSPTNSPDRQLLVPVTTMSPQFLVGGSGTIPTKSALFTSNAAAAQFAGIFVGTLNSQQNYIRLDRTAYCLGGNVSQSAAQTLRFTNIRCFTSRILLTYTALTMNQDGTDFIPDNTPVLRVDVTRMKLYDALFPSENSQVVVESKTLCTSAQIVTTNGASSPTCSFIKHPEVSGAPNPGGYMYTIPIELDGANRGLVVTQIDVNLLSPNGSFLTFIGIHGLNLETNIDVSAPVSFSQGGQTSWGAAGEWGLDEMVPGKTLQNKGCIVTSAAMALRFCGISNDPDGNPVTPRTLNAWLKAHGGYDAAGDISNYYVFEDFANHACAKNLNTVHVEKLRDVPADTIVNRTEDALANGYSTILRVARATCTSGCGPEKHSLFAFGLIPDFTNTIYGTYKIVDPGKGPGLSQPNLYRRATCSDNAYKGKYSYSVIFRRAPTVDVVPNYFQSVLCSPGKMFIESQDGYKIGYPDGSSTLVNTFPAGAATYEWIDPYEDYEPDANGSVPTGENYQKITIWNRPDGQTLSVKAVGTGSGPYTFAVNEKVWKSGNWQDAFVPVTHTGTFSVGLVDQINAPANGRETGKVYGEGVQPPPPPPTPVPTPTPAPAVNYVAVGKPCTVKANARHALCVSGYYVYWDYDNGLGECTWYRDLDNPSHVYTTPGKKYIRAKQSISTWCPWGEAYWRDDVDQYVVVTDGGRMAPILNLLLSD